MADSLSPDGRDRPALQRSIEKMLLEELSEGLEGPLFPSHARLLASKAMQLFDRYVEVCELTSD